MRRKKHFHEFIYLFIYFRQRKTGELYHSKRKFSSSLLCDDFAACNLKVERKENAVLNMRQFPLSLVLIYLQLLVRLFSISSYLSLLGVQ